MASASEWSWRTGRQYGSTEPRRSKPGPAPRVDNANLGNARPAASALECIATYFTIGNEKRGQTTMLTARGSGEPHRTRLLKATGAKATGARRAGAGRDWRRVLLDTVGTPREDSLILPGRASVLKRAGARPSAPSPGS